MERKIIENDKHLNIVEIIKNGVSKRYEISAEDGYEMKNTDGQIMGVIMCPAKLGLDEILNTINISEK